MKKKNIIYTVVIVGLVVIAVVLGFVFGPKDNNSKAQYEFDTTQELYAFSLVSGLELATNYNSTNTLATKTEFETMVDSIHTYLPSMEGFIGNENLIVPEESASDDVNYDRMMIVEYEGHQYKIYFDEFALANGGERPWEKDDDFETNTRLEGVVKIGDETYTMTGSKEIEEDEIETSFAMVVNGKLIEIEQEVANNEREFEYSIYRGETKQSGLEYSHSFGIEYERGMVEIETEYEIGATSSTPASEIELEIKQPNKDNNNLFYIEYEENEKEVRIVVEKTVKDSAVEYKYTMGDMTYTKTVTL